MENLSPVDTAHYKEILKIRAGSNYSKVILCYKIITIR